MRTSRCCTCTKLKTIPGKMAIQLPVSYFAGNGILYSYFGSRVSLPHFYSSQILLLEVFLHEKACAGPAA